jgi:hypothetical protein
LNVGDAWQRFLDQLPGEVHDLATKGLGSGERFVRFGKRDEKTGEQVIDTRGMQKTLSCAVNSVALMEYRAVASLIDSKRLLALQRDNAARALTVLPVSRSLRLRDEEMRVTVKYRLNLPPATRMPSQCACGKASLRQLPFHGVSCGQFRHSRTIARHDSIKNVFVDWIRKAGHAAVAEPREYSKNASRKIRPDFEGSLGASTHAADVQIVNPLAPSHLHRDAIAHSVNIKLKKFQKIVEHGKEHKADSFIPLIFEISRSSLADVGLPDLFDKWRCA